MSLEETIITWLPYWITIVIVGIVIIAWFRIRTNYKIAQVKQEGKLKKNEESIAGSINKLIDDAPNNIRQIESEILTIEQAARKQGRTQSQIDELTSRLKSERDMLNFPAKYGKQMKPFLKPLDRIVNKVLGGFME